MWPFGNNYPYTNFHDMNLDWIIKQVKENNQAIENFSGQLEQMGVDIEEFRAYIESIDQEIHDTVAEEVPIAIQQEIQTGGFDPLLAQCRKRRVVCIGDSYGAGWTPDGDVTGFPGLVKNNLHLGNTDFFIVNKGGARFGAAVNSEFAFDTVLSGFLSSITDKESITDIIFAGGYNEAASSYQSINEGIARCKSIIGLNFTNPSLKIWLFAIGYSASDPAQRNALWKRYCNCYARSGWAYTKLTPAICKQDWWAGDGYHPLQDAQNSIAYNITNIILGGNTISTPEFQEYANTSQTGMVFYSAMLENGFDSFLFGQNISTSASPVTLNRTTKAKILDITTNYPLTSISDSSILQKYQVHGIIEIGGSTYKDVDLILHLEQTGRNTYGLYALIFNMNDANTGYAEYTNVTQVQIATNSFHINIPYQF